MMVGWAGRPAAGLAMPFCTRAAMTEAAPPGLESLPIAPTTTARLGDPSPCAFFRRCPLGAPSQSDHRHRTVQPCASSVTLGPRRPERRLPSPTRPLLVAGRPRPRGPKLRRLPSPGRASSARPESPVSALHNVPSVAILESGAVAFGTYLRHTAIAATPGTCTLLLLPPKHGPHHCSALSHPLTQQQPASETEECEQ